MLRDRKFENNNQITETKYDRYCLTDFTKKSFFCN